MVKSRKTEAGGKILLGLKRFYRHVINGTFKLIDVVQELCIDKGVMKDS